MATTQTQTNNAAVKFRGKGEHEMPSKSQAQNRFMHAAAEGDVEGVAPKVGKEFVKADHGRKVGRLPKHVHKTAKRLHKAGRISDKQMKRMVGEAE